MGYFKEDFLEGVGTWVRAIQEKSGKISSSGNSLS